MTTLSNLVSFPVLPEDGFFWVTIEAGSHVQWPALLTHMDGNRQYRFETYNGRTGMVDFRAIKEKIATLSETQNLMFTVLKDSQAVVAVSFPEGWNEIPYALLAGRQRQHPEEPLPVSFMEIAELLSNHNIQGTLQ